MSTLTFINGNTLHKLSLFPLYVCKKQNKLLTLKFKRYAKTLYICNK